MKRLKETRPVLDSHVGCFGEFNPEDGICRKFCALCIRCAVESNQAAKMEILEDLFFAEATNVKIQ